MPCGFSSGETRTRTGDTTIFSRAVEALEPEENASKRAGSCQVRFGLETPQIPFFPSRFGRWRAPHLPLASDACAAQGRCLGLPPAQINMSETESSPVA